MPKRRADLTKIPRVKTPCQSLDSVTIWPRFLALQLLLPYRIWPFSWLHNAWPHSSGHGSFKKSFKTKTNDGQFCLNVARKSVSETIELRLRHWHQHSWETSDSEEHGKDVHLQNVEVENLLWRLLRCRQKCDRCFSMWCPSEDQRLWSAST